MNDPDVLGALLAARASQVPTLLDVAQYVAPWLGIHDILNFELAGKSVWILLSPEGTNVWKQVRESHFRWCNSTAAFLLDISPSPKQGIFSLLKEITREVGLGCPAWDIYKKRKEAMRRFVATPCQCMRHDATPPPAQDSGRPTALQRLAAVSGQLGNHDLAAQLGVDTGQGTAATADDTEAYLVFNSDGSESYVRFNSQQVCERDSCNTTISPQMCCHGPVPTEDSFDGHLHTYCSPACEQSCHGAPGFQWEMGKLHKVLTKGSEVDVVHHFGTVFGGFARLMFMSLQGNLPRTKPRVLRRVLGVLVRHRPELFPIRTWSWVAPQFVNIFSELEVYKKSWNVETLFKNELGWLELADVNALMLEKVHTLRDPLLALCQVSAGTPVGVVSGQQKLSISCVQFSRSSPRHSSSPSSSSPSHKLPTVGGQQVHSRALSSTVLLMTPTPSPSSATCPSPRRVSLSPRGGSTLSPLVVRSQSFTNRLHTHTSSPKFSPLATSKAPSRSIMPFSAVPQRAARPAHRRARSLAAPPTSKQRPGSRSRRLKARSGPKSVKAAGGVEADRALVWFMDALLRRGGVACITAWRWMRSDPTFAAVSSHEQLALALHFIFDRGNGLPLLCAAVDCPIPKNTAQAARVFAGLLRVVGMVSFCDGALSVSLDGSPILSVWTKCGKAV